MKRKLLYSLLGLLILFSQAFTFAQPTHAADWNCKIVDTATLTASSKQFPGIRIDTGTAPRGEYEIWIQIAGISGKIAAPVKIDGKYIYIDQPFNTYGIANDTSKNLQQGNYIFGIVKKGDPIGYSYCPLDSNMQINVSGASPCKKIWTNSPKNLDDDFKLFVEFDPEQGMRGGDNSRQEVTITSREGSIQSTSKDLEQGQNIGKLRDYDLGINYKVKIYSGSLFDSHTCNASFTIEEDNKVTSGCTNSGDSACPTGQECQSADKDGVRTCKPQGPYEAGKTGVACVSNGDNKFTCSTAIGKISTDPEGFAKSILSIFLSLAGGILIILIIINGYKLMTSQGDPEKIKDGRDGIIAAIAGLLLIIFSLFILQLITVNILGIPGFTP